MEALPQFLTNVKETFIFLDDTFLTFVNFFLTSKLFVNVPSIWSSFGWVLGFLQCGSSALSIMPLEWLQTLIKSVYLK